MTPTERTIETVRAWLEAPPYHELGDGDPEFGEDVVEARMVNLIRWLLDEAPWSQDKTIRRKNYEKAQEILEGES